MLKIAVYTSENQKQKLFELGALENTDFYIIQVALKSLSDEIKSNPTEDKMIFLSRIQEMEILMSAFMCTSHFTSAHVPG